MTEFDKAECRTHEQAFREEVFRQIIPIVGDAVQRAVAAAISDAAIGCPLHGSDREQAPHLYGKIKDLGGGDLSAGIRKMGLLFDFMSGVYSKKNMLTGTVFLLVVMGLAGIFGAVLVAGYTALTKSIVGH